MSDFSSWISMTDVESALEKEKIILGITQEFESGQLVQAKPNSQADVRYRLGVRVGRVCRCRASGKDFFGYRYEVLFSDPILQVEIPQEDLRLPDGLSVVFNEVP